MPYNFNPFTGNFDVTTDLDLNLVFTDSTNYTISKSDSNKFIGINNNLESFLEIPNDSSENLPDGFQMIIARIGTGSVELSAGSGVNLRSAEGRVFLRVRNSTAAVIKLSANDWIAFGDIFDESL